MPKKSITDSKNFLDLDQAFEKVYACGLLVQINDEDNEISSIINLSKEDAIWKF